MITIYISLICITVSLSILLFLLRKFLFKWLYDYKNHMNYGDPKIEELLDKTISVKEAIKKQNAYIVNEYLSTHTLHTIAELYKRVEVGK